MATNLGTLTLNLLANTGSYIAGLSRAERQTRNSTKGMADGFDLVGKSISVLKGVVAGLSVAGVTAYAMEVIRAGNEVDKLAKLSNSSVSQFQYYSQGVLTAGISIEKFADQMKDMQDRIGDFQQTGGGPLADFFENIAPLVGVTIQQFQKLSGPEALQLFYNSLEKVGATKNDIKFYMEQIISDSSQLIPLLESNGKGFKEWGERAKETGAIMSDDVVKNLVEAQKNLQIFDMQWQGLKNGLIEDVIPAFKFVIEHTDTIKAVAIAAAAAIGAKLVVQAAILAGTFTMAAIRAAAMEATLISLQGSTATTAASMGVLRGAVAFLGGPAGLALLAVQAIAAGTAYYAFKKSTDDSTVSINDQKGSIDDLIKKYNELSVSQKNAFSYQETKDLAQKTEDYVKARAAFYDSAVGIAYAGAETKEQLLIVDSLVQKFKDGAISAIEFADGMQNLGIYTKEQINTAVIYAQKTMDAKTALDNQKRIVETLSDANKRMTKSQQDQNNALGEAEKRWQLLTKAQKDYVKQVNQDSLRQKYIQDTMRIGGWSKEKAEFFADAQASANGENAFKVGLPRDVAQAALKSFNSKNYTFTKSELARIAKVQGIAKANNFAQIEQLYGLPAGSLAAVVLQESGGNANAVSPTGAKGLFQTTSIFRKEYAKTLNDGGHSVVAYATAAAEDLQRNYKKFGDYNKMFMAYNAGIDGLNTYLKGGLSEAKRAEVGSYAGGVQKWLAGVNNKTSVDNSLLMPSQADLLESFSRSAEAAKMLADKRKEVDATYFKESETLAKEHQDRIDKITEVYGGSPMFKDKLKQENEFYSAQSAKLMAEKQNEFNQYFSFETERITQIERDYEYQKQLINSNTEFSKQKRAEISAALEREKQQEIAWERLDEKQRISDAGELLRTEMQNLELRYEFEREQIRLTSQISDNERNRRLALSYASENFQKQQSLNNATAAWGATNANMNGQGSMYQIEQERFNRYDQSQALFDAQSALAETAAEREAIWQAHNERMLQIDKQYDLESRNLSLSQYSDALGAATGFFGEMLGRSSGAYKALYFAQKSFALAQAGMNVYKSASDAYANEPGTVWQKIGAAALATVKSASFVSLIQAATPQGFATGGHIVGEGTGTSDDIPIWASNGEFMIRAAAVQRLGLENLNYMNKTGQLPSKFATGGLIGKEKFLNTNLSANAGSGAAQGKVIINNYGNDNVETSSNQDGDLIVTIGKMVDQRIDAGVDRGIARNLKQGHLLSKAIRGN
ncbi:MULTISPECIES: transglycosylase SLT domain-containing protein [unclassified Acinetobacter]|uniref:transglycosylase SLT domain-containing protein n=1 Tax=unclassified Acinetobacter TaxID=196816 RepID=UPI00125074B7|nr:MULTISPECIES: transglycosylase SLT domain-containing protein [unclassified Acinetobacter]